jgi:hypothetical protein
MTAEQRERLADQIVETQPRLRAFIRPLGTDMVAGSWDLLSYSFQLGFDAFWDLAKADQSGLLLRPLLMLWRQSVELAIKAAIAEVGGDVDRGLGHNLQDLFAELLTQRAARGFVDDDDLARDVSAMVADVQAFDPFADRFRYPKGRGGQAFEGIVADLDELFQAHWIITTWCEGAALEAEEARGIF